MQVQKERRLLQDREAAPSAHRSSWKALLDAASTSVPQGLRKEPCATAVLTFRSDTRPLHPRAIQVMGLGLCFPRAA